MTPMWSAANDMDPETDNLAIVRNSEGPLPPLSNVEEALTCRYQEVISYYRLSHGSVGYPGH
eukprot:scaffold677629_cov62-Prasinocladus_malaysianus.AAC.1